MSSVDLASLSDEERRRLLSELQPSPSQYERVITWLFLSAFVGFLPVFGSMAVHGEVGEQIYNGQLIISAVGVFGSTAAGALLLESVTEKDRNFRATIAVPAIVFAIAGAFLYQGFSGVDVQCVDGSCADAHSLKRVGWVSVVMVVVALGAGAAHASSSEGRA